MSIEAAVIALAQFDFGGKIRDDDYIDVMNHLVTPGLLLLAATATYLKQLLGDPIHCWVPTEYKERDNFLNYIEGYCWITPMYNVPMEKEIPKLEEDRNDYTMGFYRWVSVCLLLQALSFKLPHILWKTWKGFSGMDPDRIIKMAADGDMEEQEEDEDGGRNKEMRERGTGGEPKEKEKKKTDNKKIGPVAAFIDRRLITTFRRRKRGGICAKLNVFSKSSGYFLTIFFLIVKLMYAVVIVAQFLVLSKFLKINFFQYGVTAAMKQTDWTRWEDDEVFPRIALCDFHIRQLQNIQTFTVQCVLSVNMFIEKIFMIQWVWFLFMLLLTSVGIFRSFVDKLSRYRRILFIKKHLTIGQDFVEFWPPPRAFTPSTSLDKNRSPRDIFRNLSDKQRSHVKRLIRNETFQRKFVREYLQADGVFILKCIHNNTSNMVLMDILFRLVEHYMVEQELVHEQDGDGDDHLRLGSATL
ncbi:hypothetical protein SNE40_022240 [Patella caerulea]|uniref:Innexin n=2 Tax=Patella caerulea TaxID=87958 RepID=A0AAN8IXE3_PATCE